MPLTFLVKFMYSEKATKFCEISTFALCSKGKSKVEISQNFGAFSDYMNFNKTAQGQKEIGP